MFLLDFTCPTPEENLALDEALLEQAETGQRPLDVLRLWEPQSPIVIVGRSSRVAEEVNQHACRRRGIPVLRRTSGGAAIVAGPGCLMYAVVLSYALRPHLRAIDAAHREVMQTQLAAIESVAPGVRFEGTCDLTLGGRKFSGNSVRCRREHLLYHGTLLYDFALPLVGECLNLPPRQPEYRAGRGHGEFVVNLPATAPLLRTALISAWQANQPLEGWPQDLVRKLVDEKYARDEWNLRL